MNADQIAEIRPALCEVIEGSPDTCATFETEGDADLWIQAADDKLNAAYPFSIDPKENVRLQGLPKIGAELVSWEAGKFVTFRVGEIDVNSTAEWIDAYFVRALGCAEGAYHLNVRFEQLRKRLTSR